MGAITAKALNSTLGTANFKGFDELMYDVQMRVHEESRELVYSETEVYSTAPADFPISYSTVAGAETKVASFVLPYDGTVGLNYKIELASDSSSYTMYCKIYKNGTQYTSTSTNSRSNDPRFAKLSGKKGDVFEIRLSYVKDSSGALVASTSLYLYLYGIYATIREAKTVPWTKLL